MASLITFGSLKLCFKSLLFNSHFNNSGLDFIYGRNEDCTINNNWLDRSRFGGDIEIPSVKSEIQRWYIWWFSMFWKNEKAFVFAHLVADMWGQADAWGLSPCLPEWKSNEKQLYNMQVCQNWKLKKHIPMAALNHSWALQCISASFRKMPPLWKTRV